MMTKEEAKIFLDLLVAAAGEYIADDDALRLGKKLIAQYFPGGKYERLIKVPNPHANDDLDLTAIFGPEQG